MFQLFFLQFLMRLVELVAISAIARDITERKKAEEALKKAHDNLEENS